MVVVVGVQTNHSHKKRGEPKTTTLSIHNTNREHATIHKDTHHYTQVNTLGSDHVLPLERLEYRSSVRATLVSLNSLCRSPYSDSESLPSRGREGSSTIS